MSLKHQPLLVMKGVESKPLHGRYATYGAGDDAPTSIHNGIDNAVVITFDDANRHVMTLGATGSRKTTSVQAPAIVRLIETGCSGLVVDVKGEYRHLADQYPEQVVVIGADEDATPYNLIQGLSDEQFTAFLNEHRTSMREPYWGSMGVQDAKFVRKTYQLMKREPTLADIVDALKDPRSFVRVCDAFIKSRRSLPSDYLGLLKAVKSNRFSILAMGESELLGVDAPGTEEVSKQYSWQTNGLISALAPFATDVCLREKFSPKRHEDEEERDSSMPSMEDLLYRDRKVLLMDIPVDRFGKTAHVISRLMRIRLISAITGFRRHKQVGCGEDFYTFFAADEYQHLVNLDQGVGNNGLFDDTTFFDRCRGYGHINLVATQSVSALEAKTSAGMALDCLLQNIGTVVVFSSADPATDRLLKGRVSVMDAEQISSVVRSDLPAGEAYVVGRAMQNHSAGTLVARVKADSIPGLPHMSRYFSGMPDPKQIPRFEAVSDFEKNPFHQSGARPPIAGIAAMRSSFNDHLANVLDELELSQLPGSKLYECDVLVCEDADYHVALKGCMGGSVPTLWQESMNLIIACQGEHGWCCDIPMVTVMPYVERCMGEVDRRVCKNDPYEKGGVVSRLLDEIDPEIQELIRIFPDDDEENSQEAIVRFGTGNAVVIFPKKLWDGICRLLGRLESQYSRVSFEGLLDETGQFEHPPEDLFDDLMDDE